jgi:hypothetical protein
VSNSNQPENDICVPEELQQELPRKICLAQRGIYYLVGSTVVSIAIAAFIITGSSSTPKEIKDRYDLQHHGSVTYTNDVRVGGMRSATVFYTFSYDGNIYNGRAFLPHEYLDKVLNYSQVGHFPVLFLPENPLVNHPYDWMGGSFPFFLYLFGLIIVAQWAVLIRLILQDLRLARSGAVAVGRVIRCSYGRSGGVHLKYEFRDMDGLLTEGHGEYPIRQRQNAQVCILYSPEKSGKSRPYPLVFFRAVK